MTGVRLRAALVLVPVLWGPAAARADTESDAATLFDQGMQDLAARNFTKACPELAQSLAGRPDIATEGALAECDAQAGKVTSAWALWTDLATSAPTAALRSEAAGNAAKLENRRPRVSVTLPPAPPALTVLLGGKPVERSGGTRFVDPGPIVIEASAPGYVTWSQELQVHEAQPLVVTVPALAAVSAPDAAIRPLRATPPGPRWRPLLELRAGLQLLTPSTELGATTRAGAFAGGAPQQSTAIELAVVARVPLAVGGDTVLDHLRVGAGLGYRHVALQWDCNAQDRGACVSDTSPTYVVVPLAVQGFVRRGGWEASVSLDGTVAIGVGGSFTEDGTRTGFSGDNTSAVALDLGARLGASRSISVGRVFIDVGYGHSLTAIDTNGLAVHFGGLTLGAGVSY